jgi:predicted negative regulator of RcsB-dependent stress response
MKMNEYIVFGALIAIALFVGWVYWPKKEEEKKEETLETPVVAAPVESQITDAVTQIAPIVSNETTTVTAPTVKKPRAKKAISAPKKATRKVRK